MIKPQDTPDLLVELIKNVNRPIVREYMEDLVAQGVAIGARVNNIDLNASDLTRGMTLEQASRSAAEAFVGAALENLQSSRLYYCDEDMSSLISSGARTLDGSDLADLSLIPASEGFCYFAKGIKINESSIIHGITWRVAGDRFAQLTAHNDFLAEPDRRSILMKQEDIAHGSDLTASRWTFVNYLKYDNGRPLNLTTRLTSEQLAIAYETEDNIPDFVLTQIFHSFLLMLQQPPQLIETSTITPKSSATIKRAKKHNVSSEVVVVDIRHKRKSSGHSARDAAFEYSVRWIVSGHWRWQWFKDTETNKRIQKRIWINPHLKGPDGKPFKETKRVHALLK